MKTIIIAGTYKHIEKHVDNTTSYSVHYDVSLYGQSPQSPLMVCFGFINEEMRCFEHLQNVARAKYAQWFKVSLSDIISMEVLNERHKAI